MYFFLSNNVLTEFKENTNSNMWQYCGSVYVAENYKNILYGLYIGLHVKTEKYTYMCLTSTVWKKSHQSMDIGGYKMQESEGR